MVMLVPLGSRLSLRLPSTFPEQVSAFHKPGITVAEKEDEMLLPVSPAWVVFTYPSVEVEHGPTAPHTHVHIHIIENIIH